MEITYDAPNLVAGTQPPPVTMGITLKKGQGVLKAGTVLGEITASSLFVTVNKASADGSEKASFVLAEEVDTEQLEDVKAAAFQSGCFFESGLTFGGASVKADHEKELRELNIYIK